MTTFSTEVVRKYHDVETTRLPEAAYFPSVAKDRPNFLARAVSAVAEYARMGRHAAPGRKLKTGRLASEGREIEHFGVAWAIRRAEFWAESIQRDLEARLLALTALLHAIKNGGRTLDCFEGHCHIYITGSDSRSTNESPGMTATHLKTGTISVMAVPM